MTKEEIRKVLDLALEYYKLEIYGTGKESEPPTEARIDWIYERMKPSLPSDLDEAAEEIVKDWNAYGNGEYKKLVKAGAEWMAGQGVSYDCECVEIFQRAIGSVMNAQFPFKDMGLKGGDKVIVQIRKK